MSGTSTLPLVDAILLRKDDHAGLIKSLDDLQPILSLQEAKEAELAEISKDVDACNENLKMLSAITKKEQKSMEQFAHGTVSQRMKKIFAKGSTLLNKQEEKKNRFVHSMNIETRERERLEKLERQQRELLDEQSTFSRQAEKYKSIHTELDLLYGTIFDGYTPGYPEEDQAEAEVRATQAIQSRVSTTLSIEYSTIDVLRGAAKAMANCQDKMREALYWSSALLLAHSVEAERTQTEVLEQAHIFALDCQSALREARSLSPQVKPIGSISIADKAIRRSPGLGEGVIRERLSEVASELDNVGLKISAEQASASARCKAAKTVVEQTTRTVEDAKRSLFKVRRKIFEQVIEDLGRGGLLGEGPSSRPSLNHHKSASAPTSRSDLDAEEEEPPMYTFDNIPHHSPSRTSPTSPVRKGKPRAVKPDSKSSAARRRSVAQPLPRVPVTGGLPSPPLTPEDSPVIPALRPTARPLPAIPQ